ncbi:P63C domain-containing protein [Caballeronia sp. LZ025]|uniref:P63C domain-containing protein n=1 Tax=Caballeronia TaxID=1827195 RepID=UPI001FD5BD50|nr:MULTISPECIES: P63C domain-containing protein [Caballeronia]MDR5736165.1 P63C domain-containing protein [Caballeronia sp. LZ025]
MATGKAKGGKAAAAKLTDKQRSDRAKKAVAAREAKKALPKATHGSADHPLKIGELEIPCYVLDNGTRVLSLSGLYSAIGISKGGGQGGVRKITNLLSRVGEKGLNINELIACADSPITFVPPHGGNPAEGYEASILPDICAALINAGRLGYLDKRSEHLAERAAILQHGFATVGIIALVDEATGYQKDRERDALAQILEKFVAKELQPYVRAFPPDYYEELFRLRGLTYPPKNPQFRPQYFGLLTNDIVYGRLAPGLLGELKALAKKDERKAHLHRRLTQDIGHPKLREHLASVTTAMKLSDTYPEFIAKLNRVHPRYGETVPLDLDEADRG